MAAKINLEHLTRHLPNSNNCSKGELTIVSQGILRMEAQYIQNCSLSSLYTLFNLGTKIHQMIAMSQDIKEYNLRFKLWNINGKQPVKMHMNILFFRPRIALDVDLKGQILEKYFILFATANDSWNLSMKITLDCVFLLWLITNEKSHPPFDSIYQMISELQVIATFFHPKTEMEPVAWE
ncbi:hypothetical protein BDB01DRAFT_834261 [Pilobolus umbonatus]|nr:hypothetical protein BDB01DRAFT_834261 [Pilobolus umbonatus]